MLNPICEVWWKSRNHSALMPQQSGPSPQFHSPDLRVSKGQPPLWLAFFFGPINSSLPQPDFPSRSDIAQPPYPGYER